MTSPGSARPTRWRWALLVLACLGGAPGGLVAQGGAVAPVASSPEPSRAPVAGRIVSAGHGAPVASARLTLHDLDGTRTTLHAVSDARGEYRFPAVPVGRWALQVRALGYRPTRVELAIEGGASARLSIGLRLQAIALQPVQVLADAGELRTWDAVDTSGTPARTAVEDARLARYLPSDARLVTAADIREAIPLGETDVFRGLQRLAGVSTRDDLSAELWVRGAASGQTRVRFDGVPLFAPLHAAGAFSALPERAVGELSFHPGVQPLASAGGAAALVLIESRRPVRSARIRGDATLSPVSAQLALARGSADGRTGWLVAGRRSTLGSGLGRRVTPALPYRFGEVVARVDRALRGGAQLEASALLTGDDLSGPVAGWVDSSEARLRGGVGRLTLDAPLANGRVRHTIGVSRLEARVGSGASPRYVVGPQLVDEGALLRLWDTDNAIALAFVESAWQRAAPAGTPRSALGVRFEHLGARVRGLGLRPRTGEDALARQVVANALVVGTLWAERRWDVGSLSVDGGARVEGGGAVRDGARVRLAPRVALRYTTAPGLHLTAAASRTYQYAQPFTPRAERLHELASVGTHWLVASRAQPAARADVVTAGVERWLAAGAVLTATGYARRADGLAVADPRPGAPAERPPFVAGAQQARGVELSLRRVTGRLTGSLAYTRGGSQLAVGGERFPAPWERQEVLHATAALAVGTRLALGGGFTGATGAAYTRRFAAAVDCAAPDACVWRAAPMQEAPSAARLPPYASLDLGASYTVRRASPRLQALGTLRNVRREATPGAYLSTSVACIRDSATRGCDDFPSGEGLWREDRRLSGAARLASAELRVSW